MNDFIIKQADAGDYQVFADMIGAVWEAMPNKEWFVADDADYTYGVLAEGKGIGFKAIDEDTGRIAGVFIAAKPGAGEENLGRDIDLPEEELPLVAHMESVAILPPYRGHRLQYRLMQAAEARLREEGYRYLMCTAHPDNCYSCRNIRSQGYEAVTTKEKYGGYLRTIFLKKLEG